MTWNATDMSDPSPRFRLQLQCWTEHSACIDTVKGAPNPKADQPRQAGCLMQSHSWASRCVSTQAWAARRPRASQPQVPVYPLCTTSPSAGDFSCLVSLYCWPCAPGASKEERPQAPRS